MSFIHPIEVRFRDLDALGHVNNAVLVSYIEVARYRWWRQYLAGRPFEAEGFLIARIEVDYKSPILIEDDVRVEIRCTKIGRTSFDLVYRVFAENDGRVLAEAKTVQVMLDFETQRPAEILPATRRWMEGQQ
jgi:acyl-CoA thioester hydrolase